MKDLEKYLRQLHRIQPDPAYARDLRACLMLALATRPPKVTIRLILANMLRPAPVMVAVGIFLFFMIGGSAAWQLVISPAAQFAYLDPGALRAEAQAIDTQIYLASLQYNDPGYERQRLIAPDADFSSITIAPLPGDPAAPASEPTEAETETPETVSGAPVASGDASNSTSTDPTVVVSSTPPVSDDGIIDAKEALEILSN